jgi:hypothetical protein
MKRLLAALAIAACTAAAIAAAATPEDIAQSYLFSPAGKLTPLRARVSYGASQFPIAMNVTPPDGSWAAAQWKQNLFTPEEIELRHLTCSTNPNVCAPPYYGWVTFGNRSGTSVPRILVVLLAGFSPTHSVAATVQSLRTRGHGATYRAPAPVKVAGNSGIQFDGQVTAPKHVFIPFSPPTTKATGYADGIYVDRPSPFRFDVLHVHGKTIVIFVGSLVLSPDQFAAAQPHVDHLLGSLRFAKGA